MRLGVVSVFMILMCLVTVITALGTGGLFARHLYFLHENYKDTLLEGFAEQLDELSSIRFEAVTEDFAKGGKVADLAKDYLNQEGSLYATLVWEESGLLLNDDLAPEWSRELTEDFIADYLDRFVSTGATEFRYDNFSMFRTGDAQQALSLRIRYFPKQGIFLGFGGPFAALSARLNAASLTSYERARVEAVILGFILLFILGLAFFLGYYYFSRVVRGPLRALMEGEAGVNLGSANLSGGLAREVAQVGAGMVALKAQLHHVEETEKTIRERLALVTDELDHLRSDFEHRVGATERELRDRYQGALTLEREAIYDRVTLALRAHSEAGGDSGTLKKRLDTILGSGAIDGVNQEEIDLEVFLPVLAKEYAEASGNAAPEVNAQCEARVRLDKEHLRGVILELLQNAHEHGGALHTVHLNCARVDGFIEISVSDTGAGFDEADRGMLYKPFYSTAAGHVGLGLAWAQALCLRMNCELSVYSEQGKGFVAVVRLPVGVVAREVGRE